MPPRAKAALAPTPDRLKSSLRCGGLRCPLRPPRCGLRSLGGRGKGPKTPTIVEKHPTTTPAASPRKAATRPLGTAPRPYFLDVLFIHGRIEDTPVSDEKQPCRGRSPRSTRHASAEIGVVTLGVTTRPENRTPLSSYPGTRRPKQGKPQTSGHPTSNGTHDGETGISPKTVNGKWRIAMPGTDVITLLFRETSCPTLLAL